MLARSRAFAKPSVLRRTEAEEPRVAHRAIAVSTTHDPQPVAAACADADRETELLPHGHPKWAVDGIAISARAREAAARLKPVVVAVLRFWDHVPRSIVASGRRVSIDPSGSYKAF
jgi:hypothetical protein